MRVCSLLRHIGYRAGFFNKKKPQPEAESIDSILKRSKNLGTLVEDLKLSNKDKPKLLQPSASNKLTIVLEMDQTFMYSFTPDEEGYLLAPFRKHDHYIEFPEYNAYLSIYRRKGVQKFLEYITTECQPVIWTTAVKSYMDIVMPYFDPENKIKNRLWQEHCNTIEFQDEDIDEFVKDLNLLGRDLKRVVYFDSRAFAYWMYPENCYPVVPFKADGSMESTEDMEYFIQQIEKMKKMEDVRPYLEDKFLLRQILQSAKML